MGFLRLDRLSKRYGEHTVIDRVSLEAQRGEFVVFVGPSGCGKSTLLRLVAGLEEADDGDVFIDGAQVTGTHPARRGVAMVFQSYALYPHMTAWENMAFGLRMAGQRPAEIARRVDAAARVLQIGPLLDRRPRHLSGGQRQRVAIGRAIVREPRLFLFDEPLSNLDAELRGQMRVEIGKLHRELGVTMVYVTHDQVEAMTLADRIVVLRDGRVEQVGSPDELYGRPANLFVAGFIGSPRMNLLRVTVAAAGDGAVEVSHPAFPDGSLRLPTRSPARVPPGAAATLGLRPEHLSLQAAGAARLAMTAELAEGLGGSTLVHGQASTGETVTIAAPGRVSVAGGEALVAGFDPANAYLFDEAGAAL